MTAFLHADEPEYGRLDCVPNSQETVVLEECGFLISEAGRNIIALLLREHNAIEAFVHNMILPSSTVSNLLLSLD